MLMNIRIRAVICHTFNVGKINEVDHASRTLITAGKKNYSKIEKEALAIIVAVKTFHKMLRGSKYIQKTGHHLLLTIFGSKNGIPTRTANRLQRWGTVIIDYDFKVGYFHQRNWNMQMISPD